ncbi:MAG TPA: 2OG-Fe(II) oxygenase [Limnobacter sp.]|nr:2OG-Fe(II) oxygenase [Limnobacter sp.]
MVEHNSVYPELTDALVDEIASDLRLHGLSVKEGVFAGVWLEEMRRSMIAADPHSFKAAGIGRLDAHHTSSQLRRDRILWIERSDEACSAWLDWAQSLQSALNRRLMLGLFSFESHFAHYSPGAFYKKHKDAFSGQANRVLSVVTYLNSDWHAADGGELVLYDPQDDSNVLCRVLPKPGTLVVFLSEEFPHEVLPAHRDRYSIAGWYRVNSSVHHMVDPPA